MIEASQADHCRSCGSGASARQHRQAEARALHKGAPRLLKEELVARPSPPMVHHRIQPVLYYLATAVSTLGAMGAISFLLGGCGPVTLRSGVRKVTGGVLINVKPDGSVSDEYEYC